jgi:hypothetical protein
LLGAGVAGCPRPGTIGGPAAIEPHRCAPVAAGWTEEPLPKAAHPVLLAICHHSDKDDSDTPPFRIPSLDEAADAAKSLAIPASVKRYLVMKMALEGISKGKFDKVVDALGVTATCREDIAARAGRVATTHAKEKVAEVSRAVYSMLASPNAQSNGCRVTYFPDCDPRDVEDPPGGEAIIDAVFQLDSPDLERLKTAIDPQMWSVSMGSFFEESYRMDETRETEECSTPTGCWNGKCEMESKCFGPPASDVVKYDWKGPLWEHYELKFGVFTVAVENVLHVNWHDQSVRDGYRYDLVQSVSLDEAGDSQSEHPCGLGLDNGVVSIRDLGEGYYGFNSSKRMSFCGTHNDYLYNRIADDFLCVMSAAVEANVCYE